MFTMYRYLTLSYQDSLSDSTPQPFGVIVETKRYVYYVGFGLTGNNSSVTGLILTNFPSVLKEQIVVAAAEARRLDGHALDVLRKGLAWNISASKPKRWFGFGSVEQIADKLFVKRVERSDSASSAATAHRAIGKEKLHFELSLLNLAATA